MRPKAATFCCCRRAICWPAIFADAITRCHHRQSPSAASPQELDRILSEAVRVRVPPNLPVAALFSGGIDSTLVMHYARRFRPAMPGYIAVGCNAPDHIYAKRYADETGLDLREVAVEAHCAKTLSLIETVVDAVETFEPAVIRPSLHTYLALAAYPPRWLSRRVMRRRRRRVVRGLLTARICFYAAQRLGPQYAAAMFEHDASRESSKGRSLLDAIPTRNTRAVPGSIGRRLCKLGLINRLW